MLNFVCKTILGLLLDVLLVNLNTHKFMLPYHLCVLLFLHGRDPELGNSSVHSLRGCYELSYIAVIEWPAVLFVVPDPVAVKRVRFV